MNRRDALRTLGHGATAGALAATALVTAQCTSTEAPAAVFDPALDLITRWNALSDQAGRVEEGAEFDAFYTANLSPIEKQVRDNMPAATTRAGALAALQKVMWFDDIEGQDANLVRSAIAFLEQEV